VEEKSMTDQPIQSTGCCDPFDPKPWDGKEIVWKEKIFVTAHIKSFLHIPINMGNVITKNMALIDKAGAKSKEQIMLTDEKSLWGSDIYIAVTKKVPGADMTTLSGTFLTKVFEGPYQNVGKWAEEMKTYVEGKNKSLLKLYFSYTTCPKCAKAYGKNYVVLFAQIK
jgi:hypothetical protein